MCLGAHIAVTVDICGCAHQLFSLRPVTLHLVIQQPHGHDYMLSTGMTQPPFDRDLVAALNRMWFHFARSTVRIKQY